MKRRVKWSLSVLATAVIVVAAVAAIAAQVTTANGPYYAWPSWDQKLPSSTRFVVLANFESKAVLDRETGLVWDRQPPVGIPALNWLGAHEYCNTLSIAGRQGWRLPTLQELTSLVDPTQTTAPKLPPGHPFVIVATAYWSATESANNPALFYWSASFSTFFESSPQNKLGTFTFAPWCVRGGQGAQQQ
jgi:hypothetical protein